MPVAGCASVCPTVGRMVTEAAVLQGVPRDVTRVRLGLPRRRGDQSPEFVANALRVMAGEQADPEGWLVAVFGHLYAVDGAGDDIDAGVQGPAAAEEGAREGFC